MAIEQVRELGTALRERIGRAIVGQDDAIHLMMVALISEGHILFEGPPGTGKTLLARAFASCVKLDFKRVQFTPDLMPGDLIGTNLFNFQTSSFTLTKGPLFTELLLADEINRTPPKTQAALLEAMQERTITIDGTSHPLSSGFMVVATQNPIEQEGTYPLPEAQLDRFLFKIVIEHPSRDEERAIVRQHGHRSAMPRLEDFGLQAVADSRLLAEVRDAVMRLHVSEDLLDYIVDVVRGTREHASLDVGASTRAANMLASAARAYAALLGRDFVIPDDVKMLALPVLRHRVILSASAEIEGLSADRVVSEILDRTAAPR